MKTNLKIFVYAIIAAFGAVVVGLNMGGISGAIDLLEVEFSLTSMSKGFVASALMIGCLIGALVGGRLSDGLGRKPVLYASAVLLGLSALGCALLSRTAAALVVYRFVGGLGVGVLSAVIPTYITEVSPAKLRGTFVSFYQLFVVTGIMLAYVANYYFSMTEYSWRLMLGLPLILAIANIIMLFVLPESPRWLIIKGRKDDAMRAIQAYGFDESEKEDILNSDNGAKDEKVGFGELFKGKIGRVVFLGSMLAFFQQITGINVVINYAPSILGSLGIAGANPLLQTILIGAANLLFTIIALWLCDKFGRKTLLLTGCVGLVLSLSYITYSFSISHPDNLGVLIAIIAYIAFFALSLSPLMFVVTSEMYPSRIRGTAMALSTGISWTCAFVVVQFYPWLEETLGANVTFGIFAILCLIAGLFIKFCIPETKGKTLSQIEHELKLD